MQTGFQFSRPKTKRSPPKLSVICLNKDHAAYLDDNLLSIAAQKFEDFEFIVADGGSTDGSLEILARYDFVSVLPGADTSRTDGVMRVAAAATGDYVMFTTSTDGYLCRNWFATAVGALDSDPEISLVWAASATMRLDGTLGRIAYPKTFDSMPQRRDWFFRWLFDKKLGQSYMPELNYCVRRSVFQEGVKETPEYPGLDGIDPILRFLFRFHREGYLAQYLPVLANFGREHGANFQYSPYIKNSLERYFEARERYRSELLKGEKQHAFRDGSGKVIETLDSPRQIKRPRKNWKQVERAFADLRRALRS